MIPRPLFALFCGALLALAPAGVVAREKFPPEDLEIVEKRWPDAKITVRGLHYSILDEGMGETPKGGAMVSVLYKGSLLNDKVFDQVIDPDKAFKFRVARGVMIDGFDEAVGHMKRGERRLVIIPYELGYGTRGKLPEIPKRATLVFEITLISFENPPALVPQPPSKKK